jgi:DNA-3-methyladenine glycosylase
MILPISFYNRDTITVAKELLGTLFVHRSPEGMVTGKIVELEAYLGMGRDPAAHAHRGKTNRNSVLFGPGGYIYIYFIYGMHYCFNISANTDQQGGAILIRALEPVAGIEIMQKRRNKKDIKTLCNGPGNLVQAMGITKEHNGLSIVDSDIYVEDTGEKSEIVSTTRIGISKAMEVPYRFYIKDNPFISHK